MSHKGNYFANRAVRRQVGLQRVANGQTAQVLRLMRVVERDIIRQMRLTPPDSFGSQRMTAMLANVRRIYREGYEGINNQLTLDLGDVAVSESIFTRGVLRSTPGISADIAASIVGPTNEIVRAAALSKPFQGRLLRESLSGMKRDHAARVRDAIRISYVEGETLEASIARLRGTRAGNFKDGVMEINRRSAERLVRTAQNHMAQRGRLETFEASALISQYQWISVLDGRVSIICAARSGKVYDNGKGPLPPAHPNCRSQIVAVFDDEDPPDEMVFDDWLKNQSPEVQNEILGVTRADAWRNGDVKLDKFINNRGEVLTLEQLDLQPIGRSAAGNATSTARALTDEEELARELAEMSGEAGRRELVREAHREAEEYVVASGNRDGVEHLVLVDGETGEVVSRTRGETSSVFPTQAGIRAINDPRRNIVAHHNHPGSSSLSPADILTGDVAGGGVWAYGHAGNRYFGRSIGDNLTRQTIKARTDAIYSLVQREVSAGRMTASDGYRWTYHMVWSSFARQGRMDYRASFKGQWATDSVRLANVLEGIINAVFN